MSRQTGPGNHRTWNRLGNMGLLLGVIVLAGCGGPPAWVTKGAGIYNGKDAKVLYGVGIVTGVRNEPLAWEAAETRARADIQRAIETYMAYLMRDYAASTTAGDLAQSTEEQHIERAVKTFAAGTLSGVRSVDRWKDEKTGTYYVLAKISLQEMQEALLQAKELNSQMREFVRKNAEKAFDRLGREEEKRAGATGRAGVDAARSGEAGH
ncbi:hypothetical protein [Nitrospira sp. Kam-Ns4a]